MRLSKLKRILSTTALLLVLAAAAGCGSESGSSSSGTGTSAPTSVADGAVQGGEFIYGMSTEPNSLDPYKTETADTRRILFNVFEGLVRPDTNGNLQPAVAESFKVSDDALSYIFTIRKGLKFHNGNEVTADDVKYSLDTAIAAGLEGFDAVASVEVADVATVEITLKAPDPDFLPYLTTPVIPVDYTDQGSHPIGTGPFKFESYTPQQSLVLTKNDDYWQEELPYLDKVTFKFEADTNALLLDLQAGSIDSASLDNATAEQLSAEDFTFYDQNSNSVQQLSLNNAVKPFDDVRVRRAISYAVDPDEIIALAVSGKGVRVGSPVIPGLKTYYNDNLTNTYPKDLDKAREFLAQAGYPDGFSFTITVPSNYQVHVDTAQVIVNELQAIGVTADIQQVDFPTWLERVYTGRQYEATIISVDGTTLSPRSFLSRYVSTASNNFVNYKSADYDALYTQAQSEPDAGRRADLYMQAQQLLSKDAASVYIQDITNVSVLRKGFEGLLSYPLYVFDVSTIYQAQ